MASAVPQHHSSITKERMDKALSPDYLTTAATNLLNIRCIDKKPFDGIVCKSVEGAQQRPRFNTVVDASASGNVADLKAGWKPIAVGHEFGPTWSTHWLAIDFTTPPEWTERKDAFINFVLDPSCEGMLYSVNGVPIQGLTGGEGKNAFVGNRRVEYTLTKRHLQPGVKQRVFVEVACNGLFGADGALVGKETLNGKFALQIAELQLIHAEANALFWDYKVINDLASKAPKGSMIQERAILVGNAMLNAIDRRDRSTFSRARAIASEILRPSPSSPDSAASNRDAASDPLESRVYAVGHCHIDSAWLWRYAETRRKVARSWASQVKYMHDTEPNATFTASQAWQYSTLEQDYSSLFTSLQHAVSTGHFVPVGGAWVEPDANMPSGESLIRQFLYGTRYMAEKFGKSIAAGGAAEAAANGHAAPVRLPHGDGVFWLPDTFGYCPQLPQIIRGVGMRYFLTQKLSWSLVNKPDHNTFYWQALDGSTVLTHFPPADTYCAQGDVNDVQNSANNNKDKGRSSVTMMLYGNGDGGGGPTQPMFEQMRRLGARGLLQPFKSQNGDADAGAGAAHALAQPIKPLPGFPSLFHATPRQFFDALASDVSRSGNDFDVLSWSGELYLELHNGTLTSQAAMKKGNRKTETALHDLEFLSSALLAAGSKTASSLDTAPSAYPSGALESMWKDVLLNQFHDVLPGSSIADVHKGAHEIYQRVLAQASQLSESARDGIVKVLGQGGPADASSGGNEGASTSAASKAKAFGGATTGSTGAAAVQAKKVIRLYNSTPYPRIELLPLPTTDAAAAALVTELPDPSTQKVVLIPVSVPAYGMVEVPVDAGSAPLQQIEKQRALMAGVGKVVDTSDDNTQLQIMEPGSIVPLAMWADDAVDATKAIGEIIASGSAASPAGVTTITSMTELRDPSSTARIRVYDYQPQPTGPAAVQQPSIVVDSGPLRVTISKSTGHLVSVLDYRGGDVRRPREIIASPAPGDGFECANPALRSNPEVKVQQGGNRFMLYDDSPFFWDAWDTFSYSQEKVDVCTAVDPSAASPSSSGSGQVWDVSVSVIEAGPLRARIRIAYPHLGRNGGWLAQDVVFHLGSAEIRFETVVEWREEHKMLKVEWPLALHATAATYETQFGSIQRPTHTNTSRDAMQFEVCGRRWGDLSQPDYGVALLNDSKYGYSCRGNRLRLSLLRSPKAPDADCDMGRHHFTYSLLPHLGHVNCTEDVLSAAAHLNGTVAVQVPGLPVLQLPKAQSMMGRTAPERDGASSSAGGGTGGVGSASSAAAPKSSIGAAPPLPGAKTPAALAGTKTPGSGSGVAGVRAQYGDAGNAGPYVRMRPPTKFRSLSFFTLESDVADHSFVVSAAGGGGAPGAGGALVSSVVLDTIKKSENTDSALIVRCYESAGRHSRVIVRSAFPMASVTKTNMLEELPGQEGIPCAAVTGAAAPDSAAGSEEDAVMASAPAAVRRCFGRHPGPPQPVPRLVDEYSFELTLQPFQVATVMVQLA